MKRLIIAVLGSMALYSLITSSAVATPPSLTGEFFSAGSTSQNGGTFVTSATCSQTSPSTIAFTASGTVPSGPYPGSFTETGFITISTTPSGTFSNGVPLYEVSSVETFFTITSSVGEVSGTKHLAASGVYGLCETYANQPFGNTGSTVTGFFRLLNPASDGYGLTYNAIITTTSGAFEDNGRAGLLFNDLDVTVTSGNAIQNSNALNEAFSSSGIAPVSGVGHATGGGQINVNGNRVAFGFEAKSDDGVKGQCALVDKAADVKIHCTDVTTFAQVSATEVRFFGNATINGTPTTYSIIARDLAEPGIGSDTFAITTGAGYSASGALTAGNVQIHAP